MSLILGTQLLKIVLEDDFVPVERSRIFVSISEKLSFEGTIGITTFFPEKHDWWSDPWNRSHSSWRKVFSHSNQKGWETLFKDFVAFYWISSFGQGFWVFFPKQLSCSSELKRSNVFWLSRWCRNNFVPLRSLNDCCPNNIGNSTSDRLSGSSHLSQSVSTCARVC